MDGLVTERNFAINGTRQATTALLFVSGTQDTSSIDYSLLWNIPSPARYLRLTMVGMIGRARAFTEIKVQGGTNWKKKRCAGPIIDHCNWMNSIFLEWKKEEEKDGGIKVHTYREYRRRSWDISTDCTYDEGSGKKEKKSKRDGSR